jgi:A/G-specific adenine glycosylase
VPAGYIARRAEAWFERHQRALPWRESYDPYHVWISEIMLQQTRMEVVLGRYAQFLTRFPTIGALARATEDDVTAAWSGLGYYRRARMLRAGAAAVMSRFGGELPSTVEELMTIDGIGRYTAGAIASVAFNECAPIVDGNVARIVARLFATHESAWPFAQELVEASRSPREFNQALMEIGALICKPRNPDCGACPLRKSCAAYQQGSVGEFPRVKSKASIAVQIPLYVITDAQGRVLMRRETAKLMQGLFVLPEKGAKGTKLGTFRHTITNRRIEFVVYTTATGDRRPATGHQWIAPADLARTPHPSFVKKALRLAGIV